jgi:hypothetical protein
MILISFFPFRFLLSDIFHFLVFYHFHFLLWSIFFVIFVFIFIFQCRSPDADRLDLSFFLFFFSLRISFNSALADSMAYFRQLDNSSDDCSDELAHHETSSARGQKVQDITTAMRHNAVQLDAEDSDGYLYTKSTMKRKIRSVLHEK